MDMPPLAWLILPTPSAPPVSEAEAEFTAETLRPPFKSGWKIGARIDPGTRRWRSSTITDVMMGR